MNSFEDRCNAAWSEVVSEHVNLLCRNHIASEYSLPIDYIRAMFKIKQLLSYENLTIFSWKEAERMAITVKLMI